MSEHFYWSIHDEKTGEIFEQGYPYSTQGRAIQGAKAFAGKNIVKGHAITIKVYDVPMPAGSEGRTEAPVHESKWATV